MDYTANVARGIALLDEKGPPDWRERISLDTLDLDNTRRCVLGQAYGEEHSGYSGYYLGCKALGISHVCEEGGHAAARFGFCGSSSYALTAAWKVALSSHTE